MPISPGVPSTAGPGHIRPLGPGVNPQIPTSAVTATVGGPVEATQGVTQIVSASGGAGALGAQMLGGGGALSSGLPLDAAAVVAATVSEPVDAAQSVTQTTTGPLSSLTGVTQATTDPLDVSSGVSQATLVAQLEALNQLARTASLQVNSQQGINGTSGVPLDATQQLAQMAFDPINSQQGVNASAGLPLDGAQQLSIALSAALEALQGIVSSGVAPVESLQPALTAVSATLILPIESLQQIAVTPTTAVESFQALNITLGLPLESVKGGIVAVAAGPIEEPKGVSSTAVVAVDATGAVVAFSVLPVSAEATQVISTPGFLVLSEPAPSVVITESERLTLSVGGTTGGSLVVTETNPALVLAGPLGSVSLGGKLFASGGGTVELGSFAGKVLVKDGV